MTLGIGLGSFALAASAFVEGVMTMARGLEKAQYTDDTGKVYTVTVKKETVAQAGAGWTAGVGADGTIPKRFRIRTVHGVDGDGLRRSIPCGTNTCDYYTGVDNTFQMRADDGTLVTYTMTGRSGERATV